MDEKQVVALFIFVPFCKIKCTYCDFNVYANLARAMEPYADAVAKEIKMWRDVRVRGRARHSHGQHLNGTSLALASQDTRRLLPANASPLQVKSIYLGGGTPSIVPVAHVEKFLRVCRKSFSILPDVEITLEANPGTMDAAKLSDLRALGVNRLSIGVQSFDDATLKRLNRGHTVTDALKTYYDARRAGFDNINLDFIYGLPLQRIEDWQATLDRAMALEPEHLSLYALKVEEGTGLEFQIKRGKYPMPDDDLAADMYMLAEEKLDTAGYEHYEISNWARRVGARHSHGQSSVGNSLVGSSRKLDELDLANASPLQSKHNLTYWLNQPYLGFGAGAHSYFDGARYWNILRPLEYIARVERGESVEGGREEIDRDTEMAETMILGLRLSRGVAFSEFEERFGEDARTKYAVQLAELDELGLIEFHDGLVRLTPRGRLLSNEVFWRFLP